jgi:hypothetical protein
MHQHADHADGQAEHDYEHFAEQRGVLCAFIGELLG